MKYTRQIPQDEYQELMHTQTLNLTHVANARQLGGYKTKEGKHIRNLSLLRSGQLDIASKQDIAFLQRDCKLAHIIDFRDGREAGRFPSPRIEGVQHHIISALPKDFVANNLTSNRVENFSSITGPFVNQQLNIVHSMDCKQMWDNFYTTLATSEDSIKAFRQFFGVMLNNNDGSVLFHCASGKDRTGVAAILLLQALGVDHNTIVHDYLLTNTFLREQIQAAMEAARRETDDANLLSGIELLESVNLHSLSHYINILNESFGGIDCYLHSEIGLSHDDIKILRDKYTV